MPDNSSLPRGRYRAFLFDMDGTIISSIASAERIWGAWALRHGLDVESFLPTIHGARSVDTVARLKLPGVDAEVEARAITEAEIEDVEGIVEITGAIQFLNSLPADQWAIVTSAPKALAIRRLQAAGVTVPAVLVTAEDVAIGKPHPDGYLLAARKLGVAAADCLVFEDAVVGIAAGVAAGATLLVVTATHGHVVDTPHASISGYETVRVVEDGDGWLRLQQ
ncbi:HAD-IA family hydrolase [Undibacterium sp.]|uniref:HAD-IA family hydrolase n=1 Tax=Undibacterium sp. TaxID=1914977 RepID=UPI00374D4406